MYIDYVTFAQTGNSVDFGDLNKWCSHDGGVSQIQLEGYCWRDLRDIIIDFYNIATLKCTRFW